MKINIKSQKIKRSVLKKLKIKPDEPIEASNEDVGLDGNDVDQDESELDSDEEVDLRI